MIELAPPYRWATLDDAAMLAELGNMAGEGLPYYLWTRMAEPGQSPWDVGQARAQREEGAFSYRNTVVVEQGGEVVACVVGYPLPDTPESWDEAEMPDMFVPLQQLEDLAPGTWYLNIIAALPACRGQGVGSGLLEIAERLAAVTHRSGLSLIVSDANTGARGLYERAGYKEVAIRPMVKEDWENPGENWVLLVKGLNQS